MAYTFNFIDAVPSQMAPYIWKRGKVVGVSVTPSAGAGTLVDLTAGIMSAPDASSYTTSAWAGTVVYQVLVSNGSGAAITVWLDQVSGPDGANFVIPDGVTYPLPAFDARIPINIAGTGTDPVVVSFGVEGDWSGAP